MYAYEHLVTKILPSLLAKFGKRDSVFSRLCILWYQTYEGSYVDIYLR